MERIEFHRTADCDNKTPDVSSDAARHGHPSVGPTRVTAKLSVSRWKENVKDFNGTPFRRGCQRPLETDESPAVGMTVSVEPYRDDRPRIAPSEFCQFVS